MTLTGTQAPAAGMFDALTEAEWDLLCVKINSGIQQSCKLAVFAARNHDLWLTVQGIISDGLALQGELVHDGPGGTWRTSLTRVAS